MTHARTRFFSDTAALFGRSFRHITRSPDTIITTVMMPIAIMLLFVFVLGGAIQTGSGRYIDYQLPGILLITIATGSSYTAYRLYQDKSSGFFERLASMPIAPSAPLWAHVLTSLAATAVSLAIVLAAAFLMGFRSEARFASWIIVWAILMLFTLAMTWLGAVAGLAAKTPDGAASATYPLIFLPFLSSAFVPTNTMPTVLRIFAEYQPVTPVVDSLRGLLNGSAPDTILPALLWCMGILIGANIWAVKLYQKRF